MAILASLLFYIVFEAILELTRVLMRRRESHPGRGRGRAGRRGATQLRGLALWLADTLAEAQPILHPSQDSQPGPVFLPLGLFPARSSNSSSWVISSHVQYFLLSGSVPDPDPNPDPPDPRVFWPPGSGSTSHRYGYGSASGCGSGS
jgi:hypothetical protein